MNLVRARSPANLASLATASRDFAPASPAGRQTPAARIAPRTAQVGIDPSKAQKRRIFPRLPLFQPWGAATKFAPGQPRDPPDLSRKSLMDTRILKRVG